MVKMPEPVRVVLDAMVVARGFVSKSKQSASFSIFEAWHSGEILPLFNGKLIREIAKTLEVLGVNRRTIEDFIAMLFLREEALVRIKHQRMGCSDPGDDHLLETALIGGARWIVSDDHAVLDLPNPAKASFRHHGIGILSSGQFVEWLRSIDDLDADSVSIDDLWDPPGPFSCLICEHSDRADVPCGVAGEDRDAKPAECGCVGASELNLAQI